MRLTGRTALAPPTVAARRRRAIAGVLLGGLIAGTGATTIAGAQQTTADFKRLIVQSGKQKAPATLGDHCVPFADGSGGECVQGNSYPLKVSNTVTLRGNDQVTLLLGAPAHTVTWRTARIDGRGKEVITACGRARSVTRTGKRWRIQLPSRIHSRARILGLDLQYKNGYASFEIGSRIGKAVKKKKNAPPVGSCFADR